MGRLKSLTILLTLGTWGAVTEGAPPQDAAPPATARQAPPVAPVKYLKAAQSLARKNDPLAGQYARAADDYRDMLTAEERTQLDALKAQLSPTPPVDPAVAPASTAARPPVEAPPSVAGSPGTMPAEVGKVSSGADRPASSGLASRGSASNDVKQQGRWLLQAAREQIDRGNYDDAAAKLEQARGLNVRWTLFDDTPAKVADALEKARPKAVASAGAKGDRRQAEAKLREARGLLDAGQYDQAEAMAMEVASWNLRFGLVGDNPTKVATAARALRRKDSARAAGPKAQPSEFVYNSLVASARQLMQIGKLDEAEVKARQALAMNVTPSLAADRADAVLHDVAMAKAAAPSPAPASAPAVASAPAPVDPNVTAVAATAVIAEPASLVAERAANDLLARGDRDGAAAKFVEAQQLKAREDASSVAPVPTEIPVPAPGGDVAAAPPEPIAVPNQAPIDLAPAPAVEAPPAITDAPPSIGGDPAAASSATAPGSASLDQARSLLSNGNFPAARQAAQQAKAQGAGLEADNVLALIGQTEQSAALKIYESALSAIRKGTEADMAHARGLLTEMSTLDLDESTQQKVQDLLVKLPREGAGHAQIGGSATEDKEAVEAQKLNAEVGTKVAEARRLMETDPEKAIGLLNATVDHVKAAGCKESVTRTMTRRLEVAIELAKKDKASFDVKMREKGFKAEIEQKRLRILEADKAKKDRVKDLMAKYEASMADGKFEEAEKFAGMAADIDPNEIAAIAGRTVARVRRHYERDKKNRSDKDESFLVAMQEVDAAGTVSTKAQLDGIDLGQGFKALTVSRRELAARLAPKKDYQVIEIEKTLNKPISLNMDKTTLGEAIKYLGDMTGLNIVPDKKALAEEAVTLSSPVSFNVNNLKLKTALKLMLSDLNLTYQVSDGVLLITSPQANQKRTYPVVYNVADLVIPVNATQKPTGGLPGIINPPTNGMPTGDQGAIQAQGAAMNGAPGGFVPPDQDTKNVRNGTRDDRNIDFGPLMDLIKSAVAPGTWSNFHGAADSMSGYGQGAGLAGGAGAEEDTAIGSITPFYLNVSLIIRHTAEVHDDIVDLLRQLRRLQDLQVSIEVRFITVSDSFFEQIGVDFDFSIQSDAVGKHSSFAIPNAAVLPGATTAGATTGTTTAVNPFLINPIRDHALPAKQPLIVGHTGNSGGNGNPGDFTGDLQMPFTQGSAGVIAPFNALTGNAAATFGIAFLSDLEVYLFLTAIQGDTRSNLVQAPKVTSFNGAAASVSNFTARNYVAQLTPIVGAGAVAFFPQISQVPDGVTLFVTPVVSADRRYVRMTLAPQFITFIQFDTFTVPAAVGGGGLGGQASAINAQVQLPVFSLTNVSTTVTVPDGGTVLLGGVKRLREERREFGVPILAKTPLINRLFRNIGIGRTTDSLMLMVTPRIIILEEEEEKLGIPAVENVTF